MNLLKVFYNSFFRTLARVLVYFLLVFLFSIFLSKIDVHAQTILGGIEIGDWSSFTNGAFYNIVSTDSIQNKGWDLDFTGMAGPTSSITTIMNSYGMGMSICDLSLLTDNYYSFTLLIGSDSNAYYHPFYVNRSTKLGISNNSSVWFTNFNYDNLSDGVQQSYISYAQSQHIYLNSFTGIFKAPASGTCLNLAFSSNKTLDFYRQSFAIGYRLKSLGSKPLTQEQISNALSQDFQNLNNSINNLSSGINTANGKLEDINSSINNDNVDDPSSSINSFKDKIASNGVITQLIGLPVTLFTKVLNSVNGTCSTYNLGSLFGTDLILPCVNIQNYLGSSLWSIIDVLISGLFVYSISRKFIKVFESMSSMNEGDVIGD